ncbi:DUF968 domain-containing protein [Escherichia coli]|uniref:DUF968 domain-containing protein n=1 Tax=Escherichia coli TaxID=562 RepID=UPI00201E3C55|nr:DUF968 domain-containing protein [Escherichia coli]MCL7000726.1 DUF968 domain-containing protein [Escherichia coli]
MRALLTPEIAPRMGIVLFRPGSELMPLFMQGRVLLEPEPERYSSFASGAVPAASQPLADALPESAARKALRLPKPVVPSVTRESDLVPSVPATSIIQDKAKKVLALKVDPESPESFMLRPKRRRWVNEKYTRWVKTQPCACCGKPADDPHHLIGHGQGGMGTKAHDLFVLPLCRKHHDELHADTVAFEEKYGSQLELIFRFIDRALAIGVLA